jgi:ATPase family protein associated with various cellular activities (AAA)/winged helix domain-containing protein
MERLAGLATEHLLLRMRMLNRTIRRAVERQAEWNHTLAASKIKGLYLSDAQVNDLLIRADAFVRRKDPTQEPEGGDADESRAEHELRRQAVLERQLLPFDRLTQLGLTRKEEDAIAACAAPELDRAYERIYGYILDDLTRRAPSVALLSELISETAVQRVWSLHVFGPFGLLRRRRLLVTTGESPNEARQELRLGPGVLDYLLNGCATPTSVFHDRAEMNVTAETRVPAGVDPARLKKMAAALRSGSVAVAGIWGLDSGGRFETVRALAIGAGLKVRRLLTGDIKCRENCPREEVRKAFLTCATLKTALWVEVDQLTGESGEAGLETVAEQLLVSPVPVLLSGRTPWRSTEMLAIRPYCELELQPVAFAARKAMWLEAAPQVAPERSRDLAARFRLTSRDLQAAVKLAGTNAILSGNGRPTPIEAHLEEACATVTQGASVSFARLIKPRRRAADLVLPPALLDQVLEIARFLRVWPRVADEWGFVQLDTAAGALKALFTGDSGTGKTLAAEVIAGELSAPLIKVDLARVVSKWIGETEKNLAAVFDEARTMHAVLFFDEADALFGRRGEVQRGTDRYANLEVSYLLQRLEEHDAGVVILASNLRDNIDSAFTRRFQVSLHFPRPSQDLRQRLWRMAVPECAPVEGIDFETLARLDLTGGGIVGAARTAALLAADAGSAAIRMEHMVRGLARQFKREARLLTPAELGPHAHLLWEA